MRRSYLIAPALICALALASCGDTVQDKPIAAKPLEEVIVRSEFPVYWAGPRFQKMLITAVFTDPGGAITIKYGDCILGGQYTCVTPLSIVTSPDNSFLPGGETSIRALALRGVTARATQQGATLAIPTGGVVVSVASDSAALTQAAARAMTPLNRPGLSGAPLPGPLPDTGFDRVPLQSQVPPGQMVHQAAAR